MQLLEKMQLVKKRYDDLVVQHHQLTTTIARLTQVGCLDATEYWEKDRYMYLLFPRKGGLRKKKYVGNHPLRVAEAREKLDNYKERLKIIAAQDDIERQLQEIEGGIDGLLFSCVADNSQVRALVLTQSGCVDMRQ